MKIENKKKQPHDSHRSDCTTQTQNKTRQNYYANIFVKDKIFCTSLSLFT